MRTHPTHSLRGMSLMEVLIAVAILSTGIVLILRALSTSLIALSAADETVRASALLRARLADVELAAATGTAGLLTMAGTFSEDGFSGRLSIREGNVTPDGSNALYEVQVTLTRPVSGRTFSAETRLIAHPGGH
jgi:prepilin-type N-terminal cleavage/methylation domain-containing protein